MASTPPVPGSAPLPNFEDTNFYKLVQDVGLVPGASFDPSAPLPSDPALAKVIAEQNSNKRILIGAFTAVNDSAAAKSRADHLEKTVLPIFQKVLKPLSEKGSLGSALSTEELKQKSALEKLNEHTLELKKFYESDTVQKHKDSAALQELLKTQLGKFLNEPENFKADKVSKLDIGEEAAKKYEPYSMEMGEINSSSWYNIGRTLGMGIACALVARDAALLDPLVRTVAFASSLPVGLYRGFTNGLSEGISDAMENSGTLKEKVGAFFNTFGKELSSGAISGVMNTLNEAKELATGGLFFSGAFTGNTLMARTRKEEMGYSPSEPTPAATPPSSAPKPSMP